MEAFESSEVTEMKYGWGLLAAAGIAGLVAWGTWKYMSLVSAENSESPLARIDKMEQEGVPNFELPEVFGDKKVWLSSFKGKTVVLNFWATWCGPCVEEFPAFVKMMKRLKGKVVLITVSSDDRLEDVQNFLKTFKVEGEGIVNLWDQKKELAKIYGTVKLPETYVLDRNLKLFRKISNAQKWDSEEAIEFLSSIPVRN